jgi:hypothetical protein
MGIEKERGEKGLSEKEKGKDKYIEKGRERERVRKGGIMINKKGLKERERAEKLIDRIPGRKK